MQAYLFNLCVKITELSVYCEGQSISILCITPYSLELSLRQTVFVICVYHVYLLLLSSISIDNCECWLDYVTRAAIRHWYFRRLNSESRLSFYSNFISPLSKHIGSLFLWVHLVTLVLSNPLSMISSGKMFNASTKQILHCFKIASSALL